MFRKIFKGAAVAVAAVSIFAAQNALADVSCAFMINQIGIGANGTVMASLTRDGTAHTWFLCSLNNTWSNINGGDQTVTPDACKALHADLISMRMAGRAVFITWSNIPSCAVGDLPANGTPSAYPYLYGF